MLFFQKYPEFVNQDNRSLRGHTPVTAETLTYKNEAMVPDHLVVGKTVLDLGSCLGATGHWCLSHGAISYTGVEFQQSYVDTSRELLSNYWNPSQFEIVQTDIENFLKSNTEKYDVVIAAGVLYAFLNTVGILELISNSSKKCVVIDSGYPRELYYHRSTTIEINANQTVNRSGGENTSFSGVGAMPSPEAIRLIMKTLGFHDPDNKSILPKKIDDPGVHDAYHDLYDRKHGILSPSRFILRFYKVNYKEKPAWLPSTLVENLISDTNHSTGPSNPPLVKYIPQWEFDESVATRFQHEANTHIPDYQKVIDLGISIIEKKFSSKEIKIIEVGSALGHTLDNLHEHGFRNIVGVESSQAMIAQSKHTVIKSLEFPPGSYDAVMANWTIHFIKEKEKYLASIYESLNNNGILILTDKMVQHPVIKEMYYDWKRSNGVTSDEIIKKEQQLVGVMLSVPLEEYLDMLTRIGFSKVDIINSRFNFNTLLCCK